MQFDTCASQGAARLLYPDLPDPLTPTNLRRLFRPTYAECQWAPTVARTPLSQVALVVQLKIFQVVGRFLRIEEIENAGRALPMGDEARASGGFS
jgi:hypothetical protein